MDQTQAPPHFATQGTAPSQQLRTTEESLQHHKAKRHHHHKGSARAAVVKRTVKYISVCTDPRAYRSVLRGSTDDVIKAICNAALNVQQGDIHLTPSLRQLFSAHRSQIAKLTHRGTDLKRKRAIIESQKGGFPFIPLLIGSALGAFGGKLFGG
jgi:hypothetical protein